MKNKDIDRRLVAIESKINTLKATLGVIDDRNNEQADPNGAIRECVRDIKGDLGAIITIIHNTRLDLMAEED